MVCSLGSGRMAVMARLLESGSFFSQNRAGDEVSHQRLAAQNIYRELRDADEANFLDEEDMHVFGLKPMVDPLHLVSCNACKKPVKASQYSAHAELCRSLNATGGYILDVRGGTRHSKPPRKERKKLLTAYTNQATPVGDQERSESIDVDDNSSFPMDVKRNSACVDVASAVDGSGVSSENTDHSACAMTPPIKRSKLSCRIAGERLPLSSDQQTASGVTKTFISQEAHNCRDFSEQTIPGNIMPSDSVVHKNPVKIHARCWQAQDVPVPLATKIYYSQRNNHLKSALTCQYYGASTKELGKDVVIPEVPKNNTMSLEAFSQGGSSQEQVDDLLHKKLGSSVQTPDQILAQNSEMYLGKSGGCLPATNFSNQFQADNVPRSQSTVGFTSKYLPKGYSFAGNSEKLLGTMQQSNGRVPVV